VINLVRKMSNSDFSPVECIQRKGSIDEAGMAGSPITRTIHNHLAPNGANGSVGNDKDTPDRRYNDSEVTDVDMVAAALSRANSGDDGDGDKAGQDQGDAWGFGKASSTSALGSQGAIRALGQSAAAGLARPLGPTAAMPCAKDAEQYNMRHRRRGVALLFNHKHFAPHLGLKQRNGTDQDRENLSNTLRKLDFEVRVYEDRAWKDIDGILQNLALEDHSDADCILIAVLSHGELGILYASDHAYKPDKLWAPFNSEACPSLAGKPKLFFIQACQGDQLDNGVRLVSKTETDGASMSYKIPTHADFLIVYSTIPGFYSWRNTTAGSWFVQALCYVLQRRGRDYDLLSNLTHVARRVAFDFQSNTPGDFVMHEKKQIPCITSMLTRDVHFPPKA